MAEILLNMLEQISDFLLSYRHACLHLGNEHIAMIHNSNHSVTLQKIEGLKALRKCFSFFSFFLDF